MRVTQHRGLSLLSDSNDGESHVCQSPRDTDSNLLLAPLLFLTLILLTTVALGVHDLRCNGQQRLYFPPTSLRIAFLPSVFGSCKPTPSQAFLEVLSCPPRVTLIPTEYFQFPSSVPSHAISLPFRKAWRLDVLGSWCNFLPPSFPC